MTNKILIIDEFEPSLMEALRKANVTYEYAPYMTRDGLKKEISSYYGLIVRSKTKIDKEIIELGQKLLFIARGGSGMDNIDVALAEKKGIHLLHAAEANSNAVTEHTIGLIFNLLNNQTKSHIEIKNNQWLREENRGKELASITVGIIGYGHVGSKLANKLQNLSLQVLVYDKYKKGFGSDGIKECSLEEIQSQADIISLHIPLTQETKFMIDKDFIKNVKNPFYLLNTSRGKTVKLSDVFQGLHQNQILGFAADVLENEKINELNEEENEDFNNLLSLPNVIFTPHIAGWTKESYQGISMVLAEKIIKLLTKSEYFASEVLINLKN